MNTAIPDQYNQAGSLLHALGALRNWRALILLALTFVASAAMLFGFGHLGWLMLGGLLAWGVQLYGASAVGIMLMHQAQDGGQLSIGEAVMRSLAITHRLVVLALLALAVFLLIVIVLAVLHYLCKIPGVGPLLYFVVSPISILTFGLSFAALGFVFLPLAGPAVWTGEGVFDTLSILFAVIRQRLALAMILLVFLGILVMITAFLLGGIFWSGTFASASMGLGILHIGSGLSGFLPMLMGGMGGMGMGGDFGGEGFGAAAQAGSSLLSAGMFGAGLLAAAMLALPGLVLLQGYCQIFLIVTGGLDVSAEKEVLRQRMEQARRAADEAKRRAEEARRKVDEQRQKMSAQREAAATPVASPEPRAEAIPCPACHAPIGDDDAFCGNCGHKLE